MGKRSIYRMSEELVRHYLTQGLEHLTEDDRFDAMTERLERLLEIGIECQVIGCTSQIGVYEEGDCVCLRGHNGVNRVCEVIALLGSYMDVTP